MFVCFSAVSRSEEPEDARAKAVHLTSEGAAAYKAEEYAKAIDMFEAAYHLYPATPLLLNISRAELKLSRCREAIHYAELFKAAVAEMQAASQDSPDAWQDTVQRACIEVVVQSSPEGATIWIDGERQSAPDRTPWEGRLPVGRHKILLFLAEAGEQQTFLDVTPNAPAHVTLSFAAPVTAPPVMPREVTPVVNLAAPPLPVKQVAPLVATKPTPILRFVGDTAAAIGGAALVTAIALGVTAHDDTMALNKAPASRTVPQANAELSSINGRNHGADALYVIGGVLAACGVTLAVAF